MSWHCNDWLLHTIFHSRNSRYFTIIKSLLSYSSSRRPYKSILGPSSIPLCQAEEPHCCWGYQNSGFAWGHIGLVQTFHRYEATLEHPSKNCVGHLLQAGKKLCGGLVCHICWHLGIDEADRAHWKGPLLKYVGTFSSSQDIWGWGRCRFWKNKATGTVIPVSVPGMFTVMLLCIYAA